MLSTKELKPGRIYTITYTDEDVDMKGFVKTDAGRKLNPLAGQRVGVKRQMIVQAAGNKTWANIQRKLNPSWEPSADFVQWWHVLPENTCIVEHNKEATRYLRGIPRGIASELYTLDNRPATESELALIKEFKKSKGGSEFCFLTLEKINILDETGEDE
jgi:hypothetical protein